MRYVLIVFLLIICGTVSNAQDANRVNIRFQLQSVRTTSGATDCCFGNDPDFFWGIYYRNSRQPANAVNYNVGETSSTYVYVGHDFINEAIAYSEFTGMYIGTRTGGAEKDSGFLGIGTGDDDACGPGPWTDYYFRNYQPGVNHFITQQCGHFYATFMLRWDIKPTDGTIQVRDNPAGVPFTNYCEGRNIYVNLTANINDESLRTDFEYYWEYHFVGDSYPVYSCRVERNGGGPILQQARAEQQQAVPIDDCQPSGYYLDCGGQQYDPACETCVCEISGYNDIWSYLTKSPIITNSSFTFPAFRKNEFNNMRLRVSIRKKDNGSYSSVPRENSNPANFFIYDPAPVLNNIPTDTDQLIESASEIDYSSPTFDIHHVACFGGSTGSIKVKSVTGGGVYKFYLRQEGVPGAQPQEITPTEAPSVTNPVVFAGLKSGIHTLIIENRMSPKVTTNGETYGMCYTSYTIYIKQPPQLSASSASISKGNGNPHPISCPGQSDGQVTITPSGGIGPYDFVLPTSTPGSYNDLPGQALFSGLGTGSYTLITTDALGCTHQLPISGLTAPEPISIVPPTPDLFDGFAVKCNGGTADVNIFVNAEDGLARSATIQGVQKSIPDDATAATYTLPAGTYQVTAAYSFGCSTGPTTFTLDQPAALSASFISAKHPSCLVNKGPADSDGYLEIRGDGGIAKNGGPYTMHQAGNPANSINGQTVRFENLRQGTYDVVVQDKYCSKTISSATFAVPANPTPVTFATEALLVEPTCFGYTNGKITVAGKDGAPFATNRYKFYMDNDLRSGEHASVEFSPAIGFPVGQGIHELKIEDSKGCFETRQVTVAQPLAINVLTSITQNVCAGDAGAEIKAELQGGTGPYTVQWKDAAMSIVKDEEIVTATSILNGRPEGRYLLDVKDARGCSNKEETASGEWLTVEKQIMDPAPLVPSIFSKEDASCFDAKDGYVSLSTTGGWSSYRYSLDNINYKAANEFTGLDSGQYTFYVRDARGCVRSVKDRVEEPTALLATLESKKDVLCFGDVTGTAQLQISGGTSPYYIRPNSTSDWKPSLSIDGLKAGDYTMQIRDENNCPQTVSVSISEPSLLASSLLSKTNSDCNLANGSAEVSGTGGVQPYSYQWFTGTNEKVADRAKASGLAAGIYQVIINDTNGCSKPLNVEVSNSGGASITAETVTNVTCPNSSDGSIQLTLTGGQQPYTFNWSNNSATEDIYYLSAGDYRVSITDALGCKLFRTIQVGSPPSIALVVDEIKTPTCYGDKDGLIQVSFSGGNGGVYSYQWLHGATGTRLENLKAGSYGIKVYDSRGCSADKTVELPNPDLLEISIDDEVICEGQSYTVGAEVANASYAWTSTSGFSSTAKIVTLTQPGTYTVKVINEKGCTAEDVFTLTTSNELLKAEFLVAREASAGDTVVVIDITWPLPDAITWQFDNRTGKVLYQGQDYTEVIFDEPGVYEISMNASLGSCRDVDVQFITIKEASENTSNPTDGDSFITSFEVYPNPNRGEFSVSVELKENSPEARLRMINLSGNKILLNEPVKRHRSITETALREVPAGVYYLLLEVGEERKLKRVVID